MEIIKLIEARRENNIELIKEFVENTDRGTLLGTIGEVVGKRAYFTIDEDGIIKRKSLNYALPLMAFASKEYDLTTAIVDLMEPTERVKQKKIERMSKEDVSKLTKNFNKVFANNNLDFAKRYSKELYLRDKDMFFKKLFNYVLMEDINSQKTLAVLALKKMTYNKYNDNILNTAISYICGVRSDLRDYEVADTSEEDKTELLKGIEALRSEISTKEELNILAYAKVLAEYDYANERKYVEILASKLASVDKKTELNEYEKEILMGM